MKHFLLLLLLFFSCYLSAQQAYLVKDINTREGSSASVENLTEFQGNLYFAAQTKDYGDELWVSDGTPEGTKILVDIESGSRSSSPSRLTVLNINYFLTQGLRHTEVNYG